MIVTQTPLRFSLVGGGSDLPAFYRERAGEVLAASIDKYIYITVNDRFDHTVRVSYSKTEEVESSAHVEHPIVRAALAKLGISGGIELTSIADIPSRGSGLGSSSAFTVGVLHALHAFEGRYRAKPELAAEACDIEIGMLGEPIGKQDQYAAAMGGLNHIRFNSDESVEIEPVAARADILDSIQRSLLMFHTGISRSASAILQVQGEAMVSDRAKMAAVGRMVDLVPVLRQEVMNGNTDAVGDVLHECWQIKKSLAAGISTGAIDEAYDKARAAGARGGKLLGAGGGGFLVFYAHPDRHDAIKAALGHLRHVPFGFEHLGTRIAFYQPAMRAANAG